MNGGLLVQTEPLRHHLPKLGGVHLGFVAIHQEHAATEILDLALAILLGQARELLIHDASSDVQEDTIAKLVRLHDPTRPNVQSATVAQSSHLHAIPSIRKPGTSLTLAQSASTFQAGGGKVRTGTLDPRELIFDWNTTRERRPSAPSVAVLDDTLRDGLQNASVRKPSLDERKDLLRRLARLGVEAVNLGLPAASTVAFEETLWLCQTLAEERSTLRVACAGRTLVTDMQPIVELRDRTGLPIEAHCFVGSSPIRLLTEAWTAGDLEKRSAEALDTVVRAGLEATFVTEDTTRTPPETLERLWANALDHGASRLCLCDTVGHATPDGARRLLDFARSVLERAGARAQLDWHGHNDRGLALAVALAAAEAGADRIHATALGIGERVGNTPLELLLLNLRLAGRWSHSFEELGEYCRAVAHAVGWTIPKNYPLLGDNAFRTATGVHAAAILKAETRGRELSDQVYSSVPAAWVGRTQEICIGHMSGAANVRAWLARHDHPQTPALIDHILQQARRREQVLTDQEVEALVRTFSQS